MLVHNNQLVVHSKEYISKFTAGASGRLEQVSKTQCQQAVDKSPNSLPVLVPDRRLFFLFQSYQCLCFHMETGAQLDRFA